jgi:hypothetical protein
VRLAVLLVSVSGGCSGAPSTADDQHSSEFEVNGAPRSGNESRNDSLTVTSITIDGTPIVLDDITESQPMRFENDKEHHLVVSGTEPPGKVPSTTACMVSFVRRPDPDGTRLTARTAHGVLNGQSDGSWRLTSTVKTPKASSTPARNHHFDLQITGIRIGQILSIPVELPPRTTPNEPPVDRSEE